MIFNTETKKEVIQVDCFTCKYFNKTTKKCEGYGKKCFEADTVGNLIDPKTGLKINKERLNGNTN